MIRHAIRITNTCKGPIRTTRAESRRAFCVCFLCDGLALTAHDEGHHGGLIKVCRNIVAGRWPIEEDLP